MERKGTMLSGSKSSPSFLPVPIRNKKGMLSCRSQQLKMIEKRFKEFKRNIVANPDKQTAGQKPYAIFEHLSNVSPKALYDPQFPSVSDQLFTGLPALKAPRLTRVPGMDRIHEPHSSSSSISSLVSRASRTSRFSIHRQSSMAQSLFSFGMLSYTEMTLGSVVHETDEEEELTAISSDRAPSMFRLREDPPPKVKEVELKFKITLTESETIFWLEIPSIAYTEESEEGQLVKQRNAEYERVKSSSKTITHTAMQTTTVFQKHQQLYVPRNPRANSSAYATVWDIYDVMEEWKRLSIQSGVSREEGMVSIIKEAPIEEENYSEEFEYMGCKFDKKLLNALMVMERLIEKKKFAKQQLLYQGLLLENPMSLEVNFNYTLTYLWTFSSEQTKHRVVTAICNNVANNNIFAVGYGKFKYTDKCTGLICIWNVKNPKNPERIFDFQNPVTSLTFSPIRPQVLTVSFYSGLILLIDIINRSPIIKASNYHYPLYYPVWQVLWFFPGEDSPPVLLTCGKDGRVFRYKKTKFFVSKKLMSMARPHGVIQGIERSKKCFARKTLLNRCPSAEVMVCHPTDPLVYVVGTAEGFVYFCSVNHRHNHIDVFVAHDGPVYNIQFNPFCTKIFLTCGADWAVRIWAEGIFEPLVTLESGMTSVQYAVWDPLRSTIIVSISGVFIEVWDIRRRTSVPKSSTRSPTNSFNTALQFTLNKYNICLGDDAGNVHILALTQMPFSPSFQDVVLAQSLRNILVTRPDLLAKLEHLGHPFAMEEKSYMSRMYKKLGKLHQDL